MLSNATQFGPNSIRYFGQYDIGASGLLSGWSAPEENHTWNFGKEAILNASIENRPEVLVMTFEGHAYLKAKCLSQRIKLFVNGFRMGSWAVTEPGLVSLSVTLQPEQQFSREGSSFLQCCWVLPDSVRPIDIAEGADARELGFCFRSVSFTQPNLT